MHADEVWRKFSLGSSIDGAVYSYDAGAMLDVIGQATGLYRGDRKGIDTVRHRGMTADYSWARSAGEALVVGGAHVGVADQEGDRGAGGAAVFKPG